MTIPQPQATIIATPRTVGLSFEFLMSSFFKKFVTGYCLKIVVYVRAVLWEQQIMRGGDVYACSLLGFFNYSQT